MRIIVFISFFLSISSFSQTHLSLFDNDVLNGGDPDAPIFQDLEIKVGREKSNIVALSSSIELVLGVGSFMIVLNNDYMTKFQARLRHSISASLIADSLLRPLLIMFDKDPGAFAPWTVVKGGTKGICRLHENLIIKNMNDYSKKTLATTVITGTSAVHFNSFRKLDKETIDDVSKRGKLFAKASIFYVYGGYLIYRTLSEDNSVEQLQLSNKNKLYALRVDSEAVDLSACYNPDSSFENNMDSDQSPRSEDQTLQEDFDERLGSY